ncbi:hypothetical protein [Pyxidicoccus caerfyrddinensis]|uniref:hypothetical protein n=1 Tax=Pyxidicoccus caerfyrddinensis TaxID=2709663 RepID=UPI0013DC5327|nr:hypothetical protein [Pyxidicoccus caerfyrddinensis]
MIQYGAGRAIALPGTCSAVHLGELEALAGYLRSRGIDYSRQPYGVTIEVDIGEIVNFMIDVHWLIDQVRFVAVTPLIVAATSLSEVALAVGCGP